MKCPLCKRILLEVEDGVDTDFFCYERIWYEHQNITFPHVEIRSTDNHMIVRSPPYMLLVKDNSTDVCLVENSGKYPRDTLFTINSINKSNIDKITNDYKNLSSKIKKLIIFS